MNSSTQGPDWEDLDPTFRKLVLRSRMGILFVAIVFGLISGLSIVGFIYNLPVIGVDPLWMVGHLIRGFGLGLLTFHLWRYQAAIKNWRGPSGEGTQQFIKAHAAAWNTGAIVLGVLLVYAIIYACVAFGRAAAQGTQW